MIIIVIKKKENKGKNSYEILYGSKTRIEFKRGVISKISIKKKYICLQFCFIWVLREVSIDLFILCRLFLLA